MKFEACGIEYYVVGNMWDQKRCNSQHVGLCTMSIVAYGIKNDVVRSVLYYALNIFINEMGGDGEKQIIRFSYLLCYLYGKYVSIIGLKAQGNYSALFWSNIFCFIM